MCDARESKRERNERTQQELHNIPMKIDNVLITYIPHIEKLVSQWREERVNSMVDQFQTAVGKKKRVTQRGERGTWEKSSASEPPQRPTKPTPAKQSTQGPAKSAKLRPGEISHRTQSFLARTYDREKDPNGYLVQLSSYYVQKCHRIGNGKQHHHKKKQRHHI